MIAAAMTTRKSNVPTYVDLAKAGAHIRREIEPTDCERLSELAESISNLSTDLQFGWNEQGRMQVSGRIEATLALPCQLCSFPVEIPVNADILGVLARTELEAQQWRAEDRSLNIIVIQGPHLDEIELVEDELILRIPSKVCVDEDCASKPVLAYGPTDEQSVPNTHRPFAALAELRKEQDSAPSATKNDTN